MKRTALIVAFLLLATADGAEATDVPRPEGPDGTYASVGGATLIPYGWADLCGRRPGECRVDVMKPANLRLTPAAWSDLRDVDRRVNREIAPMSNLEHWGTILDHWDYPTDGKGDCKTYAIWKRKLLMDMGYPRQALLLTVVRDLRGQGHTILTVRTDRGDVVLDNMTDAVVPWDMTGYAFMKRQSQADPNVWLAVGKPGSDAVATSSTPSRPAPPFPDPR